MTTGTELAKEIKKIKPHVPILIYSGTTPEHLGDVDCFLSKTEPVEKFLAMIRSGESLLGVIEAFGHMTLASPRSIWLFESCPYTKLCLILLPFRHDSPSLFF